MTVIAMTREMGTLGKDVAAGLADKLGIEVVHHELVERQLAERMQLSESAVHRFLEGETSLWERWKIDSKRLSRFTAEEILQLAMGGNVLIRGWGAAQLLRDVPHVICVRVCAPMVRRVEEMKRRLGIDRRDLARREIERNDEAHTRAVQRLFKVDWRDPTGYDLVINSGYVPIDSGVALLQQLSQCPAYAETERSRAILSDKLLEARVRTIIDAHIPDAPVGSGLDVTVVAGEVKLSGVTTAYAKLQSATEEIKGIEGVNSVTTDTISIPKSVGP